MVFLLSSQMIQRLDQVKITVSSATAQSGDLVDVSIITEEILEKWKVKAFEFKLKFFANVVEYVDYELIGTMSEGGDVEINTDIAGEISVKYKNSEKIFGDGALIVLKFDAIGNGNSPMNISDFKYNSTPLEGAVKIKKGKKSKASISSSKKISPIDKTNLEKKKKLEDLEK